MPETLPTVTADGTIIYHNDKNEWHREDGPAAFWPSGNKEWYSNDVLHREDGPAIESKNGDLEWYRRGRRHREDGPAGLFGDQIHWCLDGVRYEFSEWLEKTPLDEEQKVMLKLIYG